MNRTTTIILSLFLLTALTGGLIALAGSGGDPPTELYVRTVPAGAKVSIDGKEVGVSDDLFEVKPGTRKVKVELSGYEPAVKEAIVPESRIERVIFELGKKKSSEDVTPVPSGGFGPAIEEIHGWLFQQMSLNEVLWRIEIEYDSLVDAYSKKDLIAVDKHVEELEELISFELIETLGLPRWRAEREKSRAEFEKVNPGKTCHYMEYRFQLAQRRFREIQSSFPDKRQFDRFKISVEHVLESSGRLHQCLHMSAGFERLPEQYATLRGRWEVFWKQVSTRIPDVDKFEPANTKKMFFPAGSAPASSPEYQYVLDLASGKVWSVRSDFAGLGEEFTKKGAGDLIIAPYLACLRGGKVRVWDGEEYVDLSPDRKTKDTTYYGLPPLPCRLRVATAEGKHFDVKVLSITDAGASIEYGAAGSDSGDAVAVKTVPLPGSDAPEATPGLSGEGGLDIVEAYPWMFKEMLLNEALWIAKTEYDSLVAAYSDKDLPAVTHHADQLEELLRVTLLSAFNTPSIRFLREKEEPRDADPWVEYRLDEGERLLGEIQSRFPDIQQLAQLKTSIESLAESSGTLHLHLLEHTSDHYVTLQKRWEVFWTQVSAGIPDLDKFKPADTKTMCFPTHLSARQCVLDLASGKTWIVRSDSADLAEFTKKGEGDLIIASDLGCLRGGKVRVWDGEAFVDLPPERKTKDITYHKLPPLPCRLAVTTPEGRHFEVKVVSITDAGVRFEYGAAATDDGATAAPLSGDEGPKRIAILPEADTPDANAILDLENGELLKVPPKEDVEEFTKLGKGDLFFDAGVLGCLRGAKAMWWDGYCFVEMVPMETKGDVSGYKILSIPCRLLITTAENRRFEVAMLSVDNKRDLTLTYRKVSPTFGKTTCEAVLERVEDHYDALVKAYKNEDWESVDRHANEMSDLIRDEIMVGFKLDQIRELLKNRKPGEDNRALTRVLKQAERIHKDLESICKSKAERDRLQTLLQSIEDYGDELHDSIRDGKIDQAPVRYAALAKAWEAVARESFAKPGEGKPRERHFVRLVLGKDHMTFEGKDTTWDELSELLQKLSNRDRTVLELAVASNEITRDVKQEALLKAVALGRQLGFEYISDIGVHALGSKGSASEGVKEKGNILANPGAESGDKTPDAWEQGASIPGVTYSWDKNVAHTGKASLCIEKTAQRYFPIAEWSSQVLERTGDAKTMELSAYVKAEKMTKAVLDVLFLDEDGEWVSHEWAAYIGAKKSGDPPADHDWRKYSGFMKIPPRAAKYRVRLQVYGPGKVWFDDIQLQSPAPEKVFPFSAVTVKAERTPSGDVKVGETVRFKVSLTNHSKKAMRNLHVTLKPDANLTALNASPGFKFSAAADDPLSWDMATVDAGKTASWELEARAAAATDRASFKVVAWTDEGHVIAREKCFRIAESADGKSVKPPIRDVSAEELIKLVEDFFGDSRNVTARETLEWGSIRIYSNGNRSIRYMYLATISGKRQLMNQVFTFDADGKYVKHENVKGFPKDVTNDDGPEEEPSVKSDDGSASKKELNPTAAPRPVKITPEIGATDVDPALKEIRVTFDRDMNTDGMSWCGAGEHFPKIDGEAKWVDKRTCVLPVKLEKGKAYRLALNWGAHRDFQSDEGVPAVPTAVYFCTKGASPELVAQMKAPKVVKLSIDKGARNVPPGRTKLSVTFDQPMGAGMSWCNGKDTPKMEPVEGSAWSKDKKTCSIMAVLEPGHDYAIYLNSEYHGNFTNEVGVSLEPVIWRFSTGE